MLRYVFYLCVSLSLLSSQPALRAPLSRPKGQDYVSNVRSTVAPPLKPPPSVVVETAITVVTWINQRTCAPVSQSLSNTQIKYTLITPSASRYRLVKADFWTDVASS